MAPLLAHPAPFWYLGPIFWRLGWLAGLRGWLGVGFWLRVLDVRLVFLWLLGRFAPARPQASAVSDRFPI